MSDEKKRTRRISRPRLLKELYATIIEYELNFETSSIGDLVNAMEKSIVDEAMNK